jgi:hypothetical protein
VAYSSRRQLAPSPHVRLGAVGLLRVAAHRPGAGDVEARVDVDDDLRAVGLADVRLVGRAGVGVGLDALDRAAGTFAFAAASTFAAVSPVNSFSVLPLARWPSIAGWRCGGAGRVCAALEDVVLVAELAALAMAEPPRAAAPIAAIVVSLLRMEGIGWVLCCLGCAVADPSCDACL